MGFFTQDNRSSCSDDSGSNSDVFRSVPKHAAVFCVWKIEGLGAVAVPKKKVGNFFNNSAYVVYTVSPKDGSIPYPGMPGKDVKGPVTRAIHFWIGSNCDSTIAGAAALRAAELDAQVSATILYREAEGRESSRFLSYFKDKLIVESMNQSSETSDVTIHKVTGIAIPILTELDKVTWENFSSMDVILLNISSKGVTFLWIGSSALALHKKHAVKIVELRKENNNGRVVIVEDGYEQTLSKSDRILFDSVLDPSSRVVMPGRNDSNSSSLPSPIKLYKCSEQSGKYKVVELKSGPIFRSDLTSSSVFLIDRGEAGVWAWVGREVNPREKLEAVRNARGFVKKKGYSNGTPVARAIEGQEPSEMKSMLRGWENREKKGPLILPGQFESDYMAERPRMAADCELVDDGSAERIVWKVETKEQSHDMVEDTGIYYAEACYVMRYRYGAGRKSRVVVYYWKGAHSTSTDRETGLEFACKLGEDTSGQLVIASQGREPPHLLQIYGGKLTILSGQHRDTPPKKYLVRVVGSTPYTSKAVERPLKASSLDSNGVFILFSASPVVWCGGRSTGDSREASRRLASGTTPLIAEGKEDDTFWSQLGGRGTYSTEMPTEVDYKDSEKRLYHCHVKEGAFVGQEILGFTQSALLPEAAWLLDTGNTIWIWLGNHSNLRTLKECVENATVFLYTHPAGRDRNTTITVIRQGFEPPTFIGLFENWNHNLLRDHQSFNVFRISLQNQDPYPSLSDISQTESPGFSEFDNFIKYPLQLLKNEPENLPNGVDIERKEMHLTFDDFVTVFKIQPSEFEKLPSWRRKRLKQSAGLF
ncbi:villin-1 [Athalia rosae]|uniref:villin-1 n=1 Tax=Athalia rosae TaxID=37344 RepID=UPI002033DB58|nr:villin-1 [Athalia rosae]XP_048515380.1 villin-1 [Athalia rosae]